MAWGPFAEGANIFFTNPLLSEIGKEYCKGVGQVALRYLMDLDVVMIPKSIHKERMAENFDVFGFQLTDEEHGSIAGLDARKSIIFDHSNHAIIGPWLRSVAESLR